MNHYSATHEFKYIMDGNIYSVVPGATWLVLIYNTDKMIAGFKIRKLK